MPNPTIAYSIPSRFFLAVVLDLVWLSLLLYGTAVLLLCRSSAVTGCLERMDACGYCKMVENLSAILLPSSRLQLLHKFSAVWNVTLLPLLYFPSAAVLQPLQDAIASGTWQCFHNLLLLCYCFHYLRLFCYCFCSPPPLLGMQS